MRGDEINMTIKLRAYVGMITLILSCLPVTLPCVATQRHSNRRSKAGIETQTPVFASVPFHGDVACLQFMPDGSLLIGSSFGAESANVNFRNLSAKPSAQSMHLMNHYGIASSDSRRLSLTIEGRLGALDKQVLVLRRYQSERPVGRERRFNRKQNDPATLAAPAISSNSHQIAAAFGNDLLLLSDQDLHTIRILHGFDCGICYSALSPNGRYAAALAIAGDACVCMVKIWDTHTGQCIYSGNDDGHNVTDTLIGSPLFFLNDNTLVSGDLIIKLNTVRTHTTIKLAGTKSWPVITNQGCPPDTALCMSPESSNELALWDLRKGLRISSPIVLRSVSLLDAVQKPKVAKLAIDPNRGFMAVYQDVGHNVLLFKLPQDWQALLVRKSVTH
jgi:WD40 repeat protein